MKRIKWSEIRERNLQPKEPRTIDREVAHLALGAITLVFLWLALMFAVDIEDTPGATTDEPPVTVALNR